MLKVAEAVANQGYIKLSDAFKFAFPSQTYKTDIARQRLLQIPLACIRLGDPKLGNSCWYLVAHVEGVNYSKFACFSEALLTNKTAATIQRSEIKALLGLAQSDRERELIRYSIFRASGATPSAARKNFGFDSMKERSKLVLMAIEEARNIR